MSKRKKPLNMMKQEIESFETFPNVMMDNYKEPETWTIITALDRILDKAEDSRLSDEFWASVKNPLAFLRQELGLTADELAFYDALTKPQAIKDF